MGQIMSDWAKPVTEVQISHVCDVSAERVQAFSQSLQAKGYTDYRELLQQADVDAVYICVPPALHLEVVKFAIAQKKHVLCEKPLANSIAEAHELTEIAERSGLVNAMQFTLQYARAIPKIHELMKQNYLGKLRRIEIMLRFPQWPRPSQQVGWVGSRLQGGMALEVCIHLIHAIHGLTGQKIVHVESELEFPEHPESSEDGIFARMELADGTPVYVNALANCAGTEEMIRLELHGTAGSLLMPDWDQFAGGRRGEAILAMEGAPALNVVRELYLAVNGKPARICSFREAYEAQIVMEALRKKSTLRK
jgi:predicted dehydrogenase